MFILNTLFEYIYNYKKHEPLPNYFRNNIQPGMSVLIVKKNDQRTGKLTQGIVSRILTNKTKHTRGIKVMLQDGTVGRVQQILNI